MRVKIILTKALPPRGFFVQWTLKDVAAGDPTELAFRLERSGGPAGPWELVAEGLADRYAYLDEMPARPGATDEDDTRANPFRLYQGLYYRVSAEAGGKTYEDVYEHGPEATGRRAGIRRKAARDVRIGLERLVGHEVVLLKRRTWGPRCTVCFDRKTGTTTRGGCKTCLGTTFVGGYWNPTRIFVRRLGGDSESTTGKPKTDGATVRLRTTDAPQIDQDDVLVDLRTNQRYRVLDRDEVSIGLEPVHQSFVAAELDRTHVVYHLRVDPRAAQPLY